MDEMQKRLITESNVISNYGPEQQNERIPKRELSSIPFHKLFQYSTIFDKFLIFFAVIFSLLSSVSYSLLSLTIGRATGAIVAYAHRSDTNGTIPEEMESAGETLMDAMYWFVVTNCTAGLVVLISTYISTVFLNYSALRQTFRIRELFLSRILNQDISWYDQNQTGDFSSRIADDLKKIEEGLGEKFGVVIYYEGIFVSSLIQALVQGWKLALFCMTSIPITMISISLVSLVSSKFSKQEIEAYGDAGSIAEETLTSIRTVVAFGGQAKEEKRYSDLLQSAKNNNIRRSFFNGVSSAVMWFVTYGAFALAFWYGVTLILKERGYPADQITYDAGNVITILFSVLTGQWFFGMAAPHVETIGIAQGAAAKIFQVIATQPVINESRGNGKKPRRIDGKITFKEVYFNYPSRRDVNILRGFNLTINSGETVALVGGSGCGKSTCIQLLQRFYDPDSGFVFIDNNSISDLDLNWLRSYIGVVGQEPILFETTISENIRYGYLGATQDEIEAAAKKANAHAFITTLPQGYSTIIGERGAQLSGGQKQRIAIARALVREPAILLLDEATSALDTKSEALVQSALDAASHGCTTVIVAHRLSTVRKADRIVVIADGHVQEDGSHETLMQAKGAYYKLVMSQCTEMEQNENEAIEPNGVDEMEELIFSQKSINGFGSSSALLLPIESRDFVQESETTVTNSSLGTVMKYSSPEWWIISIGCLTSMITGAVLPIFSIIFGDVVGVLAGKVPEEVQTESNKYSLFYLIIGITAGAATLIQIYTLGVAGETLTMRLRSLMFKAMLQQEMGWFDEDKNGVGSLCARLSGEAASVQGAAGQRIGCMLNSATTIILSISVSLYFDWRLALVALSIAPLLVLTLYLEQRILAEEMQGSNDSLQKSAKIAVEAINGIRTLASLGCEKIFHDLYMKELYPYQGRAKRNTHFRGVVNGLSRSLMFFSYAAVVYYGATLVRDEGLHYGYVFIVSECLRTGSWSLSNAVVFSPNYSEGLIAANRIFQLLSRTPKIVDGSKNVTERWDTGKITYKNTSFSYPNRPSVNVLKGLNLSVLQGKMVALVGPSGCGKSTIVQLLERFYDPTLGSIDVDDRGIDEMNLVALRSHLGIVSQEPNLFSRTITENIAYGDNSRSVSNEEVISAAKQANIHTFIISLPLGYETKLGEKGTQLSGGQKQRVAIARALVRNPKVLLLDEATSALDAESEKVVQEALDNAKLGRTCISIAHRLTTIQDADLICVINHGRIAEMGTHTELINRRGLYYSLYTLQNYK